MDILDVLGQGETILIPSSPGRHVWRLYLNRPVLLRRYSNIGFSGKSAHGTPAQKACIYLSDRFPNATHYPNTTFYTTDKADFWSAASALGPACIFAHSCAEDLGWAVTVLKHCDSPFAIKGGGHMPIGDFNNINSTLFSSTNFKQLRLEPDGGSVHVGPGNHWIDVYKPLEPSEKTVVGGRLGIVGVSGFVTGGGISFFSWQYGWSNNNLKSYTAVLVDGSAVKATPNNTFAHLFWALRGGGNSFALVTDIEMITYDSPFATIGITKRGTVNISEKYADTVYDFALNGQQEDPKLPSSQSPILEMLRPTVKKPTILAILRRKQHQPGSTSQGYRASSSC